jgi:hypothetical protein
LTVTLLWEREPLYYERSTSTQALSFLDTDA